jgi:hypothetical protein
VQAPRSFLPAVPFRTPSASPPSPLSLSLFSSPPSSSPLPPPSPFFSTLFRYFFPLFRLFSSAARKVARHRKNAGDGTHLVVGQTWAKTKEPTTKTKELTNGSQRPRKCAVRPIFRPGQACVHSVDSDIVRCSRVHGCRAWFANATGMGLPQVRVGLRAAWAPTRVSSVASRPWIRTTHPSTSPVMS